MRSSVGNAVAPTVPQRAFALGAGIALNIAALILLVWLRGPTPASERTGGESPLSISLETHAPTPHAPHVVAPRFRQKNSLALATPAKPAGAAVASNGTTSKCSIAEDIAKGIMADTAALDAIHNAPADIRSVSDAIVVWNAEWAPATAALESPLEPVRTSVVATLQAAPEECISGAVSGPRLIAIPIGERSTILVFGSGDWSWKTLIAPDGAADDERVGDAPSDPSGQGNPKSARENRAES